MACSCSSKKWYVTAADGRTFTDIRTQAEASSMARRLNGTYGVQTPSTVSS
jgi:hypothetical protein